MRLCVVGTGYVGLVAGAGFAEFGNTVTCVDIDEQKIKRLKEGVIPIYEPGLEPLVARNAEKERLLFSTDIKGSAASAEVVFLAVGTPMGQDGRADLSQLHHAARMVAGGISKFTVIVTKSTVPVGTCEELTRLMSGHTGVEFTVASNPEFLKEGDAVADFMKPDRVILGTSDERATRILRYLYAPFVRTNDRIMVMDPRSAELTKYASNAYLATRVSFINEMALLCERLGADVEWVRRGMGADQRIGPKFLFPGIGYGGSCFPKDVQALMHMARSTGKPLMIVEAGNHVNDAQKALLAEKVLAHFGQKIDGKRFAVWGLSFKPQTDDVREAPSLKVVRLLLSRKALVRGFDPEAGPRFMEILDKTEGFELSPNPYDAVRGASGLLLLTEWPEFRRPDFTKIGELMAEKVVFDGRNIWSPELLGEQGFTYYGVGRKVPTGPNPPY